MAKLSLKRYEIQIRIFFILLVFALLVINIMNVYLLASSRRTLVTSKIEQGKAMSSAAFREIRLSGATGILSSSGEIEFPVYSSYLRGYALKSGLSSLAVLNANGNVLVKSENYAPMESDTDFTGLEAARLRSLRSGIGVHTLPEGGRIVYFEPVLTSAGAISGFMKSVYTDFSLETEEKNYKILIYSQAFVIIIILILGVIFGSWVVKPFRAIGEAASRLPEDIRKEWGWSNEPVLVEESFKKVLERIVLQEESLKQLHSDAESLAGSIEAFVEKVARDMVSGVIYLDGSCRVITMNPEAAKITGIGLEDVKGKYFIAEVSHIEDLSNLIETSLKEGRRYSREVLRFVGSDGRKGHLGVAITPVKGESGEAVGVLCMLTDLTEIQSLQERGRLRENLAAVGAVAAGIAHEFRNSLGAILAYARLITRGQSQEDSKENAQAILKEVEAAKRVVDDFLSYTKPAKLNLAMVDLKKILHELKDDLMSSGQFPGLSIELKCDSAIISADELLMKQAFFNIIKNSAEAYGSNGGKVEIAVENLEGKKIGVSFTDHAGGIPDGQIDKIFIPFFSTKESGTGLGLALAQKIVVNHDGIIEAENRKAMGLTFNVTLPAKTS